MRQYILLAAIAILAVAAIGGGYCYYLNQTKAAFVVMVDITDDIKLNIDTSEVPSHIAQISSKWSETNVRFSTFSNLQNGKIISLSIPAEFPLMGNPAKRSKLLQDNYQKIFDTLNHLVSVDTGRPQSVIYAVMVHQLNYLSALKVHTKEAIFYTDCQENTDSFSVYRDIDFNQVLSSPEKVQSFFARQLSLESLKGIKVYMIYNTSSPELEKRFLLMAGIWAKIFQAKGATVIIGPNLLTN